MLTLHFDFEAILVKIFALEEHQLQLDFLNVVSLSQC